MSHLPLKSCSLEVVNISLTNAPILKEYYWRSLNISELNKALLHLDQNTPRTITMHIPAMPINSSSIKICFHVLNCNENSISWRLKRTKLCSCGTIRKPLGLSTFRNAFDCPHRDLLTIYPNSIQAPAQAIFYLTLNVSYTCSGNNVLGYELIIQGMFKLNVRFHFDIYEFDPVKLILTDTLLPTCIHTSKQVIQPIWVYNPFLHDIIFKIETKDRTVRIMEDEIFLKSKSTYPILVDVRPTYIGHFNPTFIITFMGFKNMLRTKALATDRIPPLPLQLAPSFDSYCPESPVGVYKNHFNLNIETEETITKMIILHNNFKDCIQFRWLKYSLKGYLEIIVSPSAGSLKPKRSRSCIIKVTSSKKQLDFVGVPITCEIYDTSGMEVEKEMEYSIDSSLDEIPTKSNLLTPLLINLHIRCEARTSYEIPSHAPCNLPQLATVPSPFDDFVDKLLWNFIHSKNVCNDIVRKNWKGTFSNLSLDGLRPLTHRESVDSNPWIILDFRSENLIKSLDSPAFIEVLQELTFRVIEDIQQNWRFISEEVIGSIQ